MGDGFSKGHCSGHTGMLGSSCSIDQTTYKDEFLSPNERKQEHVAQERQCYRTAQACEMHARSQDDGCVDWSPVDESCFVEFDERLGNDPMARVFTPRSGVAAGPGAVEQQAVTTPRRISARTAALVPNGAMFRHVTSRCTEAVMKAQKAAKEACPQHIRVSTGKTLRASGPPTSSPIECADMGAAAKVNEASHLPVPNEADGSAPAEGDEADVYDDSTFFTDEALSEAQPRLPPMPTTMQKMPPIAAPVVNEPQEAAGVDDSIKPNVAILMLPEELDEAAPPEGEDIDGNAGIPEIPRSCDAIRTEDEMLEGKPQMPSASNPSVMLSPEVDSLRRGDSRKETLLSSGFSWTVPDSSLAIPSMPLSAPTPAASPFLSTLAGDAIARAAAAAATASALDSLQAMQGASWGASPHRRSLLLGLATATSSFSIGMTRCCAVPRSTLLLPRSFWSWPHWSSACCKRQWP